VSTVVVSSRVPVEAGGSYSVGAVVTAVARNLATASSPPNRLAARDTVFTEPSRRACVRARLDAFSPNALSASRMNTGTPMTANAAWDGPRDRRPADGLDADDDDDDDDDDARESREATPASELRRVMPIMDGPIDGRGVGVCGCGCVCGDYYESVAFYPNARDERETTRRMDANAKVYQR
jgi:hypothetical protein